MTKGHQEHIIQQEDSTSTSPPSSYPFPVAAGDHSADYRIQCDCESECHNNSNDNHKVEDGGGGGNKPNVSRDVDAGFSSTRFSTVNGLHGIGSAPSTSGTADYYRSPATRRTAGGGQEQQEHGHGHFQNVKASTASSFHNHHHIMEPLNNTIAIDKPGQQEQQVHHEERELQQLHHHHQISSLRDQHQYKVEALQEQAHHDQLLAIAAQSANHQSIVNSYNWWNEATQGMNFSSTSIENNEDMEDEDAHYSSNDEDDADDDANDDHTISEVSEVVCVSLEDPFYEENETNFGDSLNLVQQQEEREMEQRLYQNFFQASSKTEKSGLEFAKLKARLPHLCQQAQDIMRR